MTTMSFDYHRPQSLEEASSILLEAGPRATLLAGGTDLLVRMKRGLLTADVVVDLRDVEELSLCEPRPEGFWLGAMCTAATIAGDVSLQRLFPAVTQASRQLGAMQVRNMATLGGGLCSGLRCQFRDQSQYWRSTIGACLLDSGATCHADARGRCLATIANDIPPALVALGARLELHGPSGARQIDAEQLYTGDGQRHLALEPGELLVGAALPWARRAPQWLSISRKTRLRKAIDRPLVAVSIAAELGPEAEIRDLRIAACGQGPAVELVPGLQPFIGARLDDAVASSIGRQVARWFTPTPAIRVDARWRRLSTNVLVRRALGQLAEQAKQAPFELDDDENENLRSPKEQA